MSFNGPSISSASIDGAGTYVSDLWKKYIKSPLTIRRCQIVERMDAELRLQPSWSDGSPSNEAVEICRRAVKP